MIYKYFAPSIEVDGHSVNLFEHYLTRNSISLCSRRDFNDPFDSKAIIQAHDKSYEMLLSWSMGDILDDVGITCFSAKNDSMLMWSHYARNHEGGCLIFDTDKDVDLFQHLYKIEYSDDLPVIGDKGDLCSVLSHKAKCWEYEDEYRIILPYALNEKKRRAEMSFKKESLVGIIMGCRISADNRDICSKLSQRRGIDLYRCELLSNQFKLNIVNNKVPTTAEIARQQIKNSIIN